MPAYRDETRQLHLGHVIRQVRPDWTMFVPRAAWTLTAFWFGLFIVAGTPSSTGNVSYLGLKIFIWVLVNLFLFGSFAVRVVQWRYISYWFTETHIGNNSGVIVRRAETVPLDRVTDATLVQGWPERLFGCGDLAVFAPGRSGPVRLKWITDPAGFLRELLRTIERRKHGGSPNGPPPVATGGGALPPPLSLEDDLPP